MNFIEKAVDSPLRINQFKIVVIGLLQIGDITAVTAELRIFEIKKENIFRGDILLADEKIYRLAYQGALAGPAHPDQSNNMWQIKIIFNLGKNFTGNTLFVK